MLSPAGYEIIGCLDNSGIISGITYKHGGRKRIRRGPDLVFLKLEVQSCWFSITFSVSSQLARADSVGSELQLLRAAGNVRCWRVSVQKHQNFGNTFREAGTPSSFSMAR